jgi:hypothetical protein
MNSESWIKKSSSPFHKLLCLAEALVTAAGPAWMGNGQKSKIKELDARDHHSCLADGYRGVAGVRHTCSINKLLLRSTTVASWPKAAPVAKVHDEGFILACCQRILQRASCQRMQHPGMGARTNGEGTIAHSEMTRLSSRSFVRLVCVSLETNRVKDVGERLATH